MSSYLIHCVQKRKWYVDEYLIPAMIEQGIERENILVFNDTEKLGNLRSFIRSADLIHNTSGGIWHLQDDVMISSDFKKITEEFDNGIVCGFCNEYSEDLPIGVRPVRDMWYSFPCIRIPNRVLKDFVTWFNRPETQNKYRAYIEANKFDDTMFRAYMLSNHNDMLVQNLYPNIVENVDYLIGGSIINTIRRPNINIRALYFTDTETIGKLEKKLKK